MCSSSSADSASSSSEARESGVPLGVQLADTLAKAIEEGRPHRASAEHAAHGIEVLEAVETAAATGGRVAVHSGFPPPEPLEWAR